MLAYYKGKYLIVSILSLILDGIIVYFMPISFYNLNYFYPMFTISLIAFLYKGNEISYYKYSFLLGFVYDIIYGNLFLYNSLIFLLLSLLRVSPTKSPIVKIRII